MTIPPFVIGIAGGTGAGKTAVSHEATDGFDEAVTQVPLDEYYEVVDLPPEERESINYDHPSAFEWELIRTQLERLLEGRAIEMPQYDFIDHARIDGAHSRRADRRRRGDLRAVRRGDQRDA